MSDLTTTAAVKRQLDISGTLDDDLIASYVTQASAMFETETAVRFYPTGGGTLYHNAGQPHVYGRQLFFDEYVYAVERIVNGDGEALTSTHFQLLPPNQTPKYAALLLRSQGKAWTYTNDPENAIRVEGTLGYCSEADRPADVTLAVTRLAAWLYQTRDSTGDIKIADGMTIIPANAPQMVLNTAQKYARVQVFP